MKKSRLRKILEHEEILNEENGRATWETSHRCCIKRKVIRTEVTTGGRFDFSWTLSSAVL